MNGYEIVNELMNEGRHSIGENELREICGEEYPIVIAILRTKYKGKYYDSWDLHYCGSWCWENPSLNKKAILVLYYHMLNDTELNFESIIRIDKEDEIDYFIDEIIRLEEPLGIDREKIKENLLINNCFKGKKRLWIVNEEQSY